MPSVVRAGVLEVPDPLRTVFIGTDAFGLPTLEALEKSGQIALAGVVTGPDKRAGRGKKLAETPVANWVQQHRPELPLLKPPNLKDPAFHRAFADLDAEAALVVAFRILPPAVFDQPRLGTLNVHPSDLPRYRGPAPLNWALINGDAETRVSIIRITKRVDAGGVVLKSEPLTIGERETAHDLALRLAPVGGELAVRALLGLRDGTLEAMPQREADATRAPKLSKGDGVLDWRQTARQVHDRARGVTPWPGAQTSWRGELLKLADSVPIEDLAGEPGIVLEAEQKRGRIVVACGEGAVAFRQLQAPGTRMMPADAFLRGRPLAPGEQLGSE